MNKELGELIKRNALSGVIDNVKQDELVKLSFKSNYKEHIDELYKKEKDSDYLKLVRLKNGNYAFSFYDGTYIEENTKKLDEKELKEMYILISKENTKKDLSEIVEEL